MEMSDLEIARNILKEKNFNIIFVKNGKVIFKSSEHGLKGFIQAINEFENGLYGASLADKTIGKAAAMLCVYSKVKSVFAITISDLGASTLKKHNIFYQFENHIPNILNKEQTDVCPFEKLVLNVEMAIEAFEKINSFFR